MASTRVEKESVEMQAPMEGCTSHYLINTDCTSSIRTLPVPEITVPQCAHRQVEAVETPNPMAPKPSYFTSVRHLVEYPEVDKRLLAEFEEACSRYEQWMEEHKGLHDEVAARMQREAEAKAVAADAKKQKKNKK
ncbi:hypothetical protein FOL47_004401 [Perkinsus chesapeaki]|uniref:Uncharacterized protein n=1 Tax=Perkinsus chesapeaki TaxID=330153 RepID=A0A7J6MZ60_PERCH|nr:hypothetical protein FOL47_004401 [Perkinsus chesapeaki]